ncbi:hypothetical protein C8Q76DRAFT_731615 [Earliella scabrosa]|nr:hypothetical protein C8Q76DRAFT_731615 [Earliella scabrosa]
MGEDLTSSTLTAAERALKESLLPKEFRDVHLYAFTRRTLYPDGSIKIDHPQSIVAIGSILKDTDYFSKLLTSGFSEANPNAADPIRQYALESEYDHELDSDLEEFEEKDVDHARVPEASGPSSSSSKGKSKDESVDSEGAQLDKPPPSKQSESVSKHHQILIPSIAHRTLTACVFYLYTGKINFLPLKSAGSSKRRLALLRRSDKAPACSPKSMYRLAELYGISELQELAYKEIISQLKSENIVEEAFSSFFARYDKLREHAVSYLSQHYSNKTVQSKLPETIERVVLGDMPHAGPVLRSLLGLRIVIAKPSFTESAAAATKLAKPHPPTLTKPVNVMWRGPTPTSGGSAGSGPPRIGSLFDSFVVNAIATSSSSSVGGPDCQPGKPSTDL